LIDRFVRGMDADYVVTDNVDAGYQLTRALLERGHRRMGFMTTELDNTATEDRLEGYRKALAEAGLPFEQELIAVFQRDGEPASTLVSRLMAQRKRPSAFVCTNDGIAEKISDSLAELGYQVPGDVELATVDDNEFADASEIPMITVSQAGHEMGRRSADVLLGRIAEPNRTTQHVLLKATLRIPEQARISNVRE